MLLQAVASTGMAVISMLTKGAHERPFAEPSSALFGVVVHGARCDCWEPPSARGSSTFARFETRPLRTSCRMAGTNPQFSSVGGLLASRGGLIVSLPRLFSHPRAGYTSAWGRRAMITTRAENA